MYVCQIKNEFVFFADFEQVKKIGYFVDLGHVKKWLLLVAVEIPLGMDSN